jgi:catechol 2,3-dioxygenase-like lactoylglutathione lyase family enzyme
MNIRQIKETCIYVSDLDITEKFYHEILGFELISKVKGRHVFFRAGTSVLLCFNPEKTKNDTSLPPHYAYGPMHLAFEVDSSEYDGWKNKIRDNNIPIIQEQEWKPGIQSFYFHDPDGHVLEIVPYGMWD